MGHCLALVIGYDEFCIDNILDEFCEKAYDYYDRVDEWSQEHKDIVTGFILKDNKTNDYMLNQKYAYKAEGEEVDWDATLKDTDICCFMDDRMCIFNTDFIKKGKIDMKSFNKFLKSRLDDTFVLELVDIHV